MARKIETERERERYIERAMQAAVVLLNNGLDQTVWTGTIGADCAYTLLQPSSVMRCRLRRQTTASLLVAGMREIVRRVSIIENLTSSRPVR